MTQQDNSRTAFEAWAKWYALPLGRVVSDERYESMETEAASKAWQAAIAHARQQRGEPVAQEETERTKWLASLFPEDRMFEEISDMARESYRRHVSVKRGQQSVLADNQDSHIIWATKRWIEKNEPNAPQPAEPTIRNFRTVAEPVRVPDAQPTPNALTEPATPAEEEEWQRLERRQ